MKPCLFSWVKWKLLSHIKLFATPWTIQFMEFSRPEYWSGQPFPSPRDLPNPGIEPRSPALQADSLPAKPPGKPKNIGVGNLSFLQQIFPTQESNRGLLHCKWILYQLSQRSSIWCGFRIMCVCVCVCVCVRILSHSVVSDSLRPPWTVAYQAPLSKGILQARILEWVVMPCFRGSSQARDWTRSPALQADSLPTEPPEKPPWWFSWEQSVCEVLYFKKCSIFF